MRMPEMDVTPRMLETLEMFIASDVYRQGLDPALLEDLTGLLAAHNHSPQMRTAITLLSELRCGRIVCTQYGPTDR